MLLEGMLVYLIIIRDGGRGEGLSMEYYSNRYPGKMLTSKKTVSENKKSSCKLKLIPCKLSFTNLWIILNSTIVCCSFNRPVPRLGTKIISLSQSR